MKTKLLSLAAIFIIAIFSNNVMAQNTATTGTVDVTATIIAPISISAGTEMNFGTIVTGTAISTIKLTDVASTVRSVESGDASFPSTTGDTPTSSSFTVNGEGAYGFDITLPGSIVITNGTPAEDMTVNAFTSNGTISDSSSVLSSGTFALYVGATLNLAADQPSGVYAGTYTVTVAYN